MSRARRPQSGMATAALAGLIGAATASTGLAAGVRPDATMLQFPDVSQDKIVFVYGNDLYEVSRKGGEASLLASPDGKEAFPKYSPDGSSIAFTGNYEGDRDIYVMPAAGSGLAERITHHPATEIISSWTPDGRIMFWQNGLAGLRRQMQLFTVSAAGGMPEQLPVPYGTNGAISPDGKWLAYTPWSRDTRTWKRYRGGMASDIWLFNLETYESKKITDWEGTDTIPMWQGDTVYYLSDAGPAHRLNIWSYSTKSEKRKQVTVFEDYDLKWPSIGPGAKGEGEIVFQYGSEIVLLNLRTGRPLPVDIVIPGDRPTLRAQRIDFSKFIANSRVSGQGNRVIIEARGDLWSLPAKEGVTRRITATSGIAERDPALSPDGEWLAYFSDETGENELYMTKPNGRGEAIQLTSDGKPFKYMQGFSPDSHRIVFTDKTGAIWMHTLSGEAFDEPGETVLVAREPWANPPDVSWSQDSGWMAFVLADENNRNGVVNLYHLEDGSLTTVTDPMFSAGSVTFDRKGDWLYFTSGRNFKPTYSEVDTTWVYRDNAVVMAVPLRKDVENHLLPKSDEIEVKADKDKDGKKGDDEGENDDEEATGIAGKWSGAYTITEPAGVPDQSFTLRLEVADDGTVSGTLKGGGDSRDIYDVSWDEASGKLTFKLQADSEYTLVTTLADGALTGTWSSDAGMSGTISAGFEAGGDDADESSDDEPVEIDLEGFEKRAIRLDIDPGSFAGLGVNDKGVLIVAKLPAPTFGGNGPSGATLYLYDFLAEDADDRSEKKMISGVQGGDFSADGKRMLVKTAAGLGVIKTSASQTLKDKVPTDAMKGEVNPREEWYQLVRDAWRIERDFFYQEDMHGVDWNGVLDRYLPLVEDCVVRDDVTFLIQELISELNVGHAYYRAKSTDRGPEVAVGMLGADYELASTDEGTAYRITRIYQGAPWDDDARGPLSQQGVDVKVGDFVLAVNGIEVDTSKDIWAAFIGTVDQTIALTVSDSPVMNDEAREVLIKPIDGEMGLRYRAWVERNRRYVDYRSGGKIGYIYVPNTGIQGQNELVRQFYGQIDRAGLIFDDRWNGGGQIPTRFIEMMNRPVTNYWARRDGKDWTWPPDSHQGPMAMLINGLAGSGGDMFPALFRQAGLGKLIGMRTWGGLVGISGNPALIDGTSVTVPTFGYYETNGTWGIEGHGVDPDIEVVDDPAKMLQTPGGDFDTLADPQLDAAIEQVMGDIAQNPYTPPARPAAPDRSGMGVRPEDK